MEQRRKRSSSRRGEAWMTQAFVAVGLVLLVATSAFGGVYHSRESAIDLAFPDADRVEERQLILTDSQVERIQDLAGSKLPSRLVQVYEGQRDGAVIGHAFIETHRIRSLPETLMVRLDVDGRSRGVHLLAFHEPPEYRPGDAWLGQFEDRELDEDLALRRGVAGIAGSTLTANAVTAAVRRVMAIHTVCLAPAPSEAPRTASTR